MTCSIRTEVLPFTITHAKTPSELLEIVALRTQNLVPAISKPDNFDFPERILVARDKHSGELIGTIRYHLPAVQSCPLSEVLRENFPTLDEYVYLDRFSVRPGIHQEKVGALLIKATYFISLTKPVNKTLLVSLRGLTRFYRYFGFPLVPGYEKGISLVGLKDEPYYPLSASMSEWPAYIRENRPLFAATVFDTYHSDLKL
jgi:hypothetical protein